MTILDDECALLAGIRSDPENTLRRLVYADWLDENGFNREATLIRVECELYDPSGEEFKLDPARLAELRAESRRLRMETIASMGPEIERLLTVGYPRSSSQIKFDRGLIAELIVNSRISRLPENLHIAGDLILSNAYVQEIPASACIGGDVHGGAGLQLIPEGFRIGGGLSARGSGVVKMPTIHLGGSMDLSSSRIEELPEALVVPGNLSVVDTPITRLPTGLRVGGYLHAQHSKIVELPDGLSVEGSICLSHTPLERLPDDLHVRGDLDLRKTRITGLPNGLQVGGDLALDCTAIGELPEDLCVGGWLTLCGNRLTPESAGRILSHPHLTPIAKRTALESAGYRHLASEVAATTEGRASQTL